MNTRIRALLVGVLCLTTSVSFGQSYFNSQGPACTSVQNGSTLITFPNTTIVPGTDGVLTVDYSGDLGSSGEFIQVFGESGAVIGTLNGGNDCNVLYTDQITIPQADMTTWYSDGIIELTFSSVNATTNVDPICACGSTGTGSNSFSIDATLSYQAVCSGQPMAGNIQNSGLSCQNGSFDLTMTNGTSGGGITYVWQSSPDAVNWTAINNSNDTNITVVNGSSVQELYYRAIITCSASNLSDTSAALLVPFGNCANSGELCSTVDGGTVSTSIPSFGNPGSDGTLTITYYGDLGSSTEFLEFFDENGVSLGIGQSNSTTDCALGSTLTLTIPLADLIVFMQDGALDITTTATSQVDAICGVNSFCVDMNLSYTPFNGANDAGLLSIDSPRPLQCVTDTILAVTLSNAGQDTLNSAVINWEVNGNAQPTINWTGSILPGLTSDTSEVLGTFGFQPGDTIVVWTSMPNGVQDSLPGNDTITYLVPQNAMNGIYTIDPLGAGPTNFLTYTDAVQRLDEVGVCGPVVFEASDTTFDEQITISPYAGASVVNTVTFTSGSQDSSQSILRFGANSSGANYVVFMDGVDHVRFTHLTVEGYGSSYSRAFVFQNGADSNMLANNIIRGGNVTSTSTNHSVIYSSGDEDQYNVFDNNVIENGSYGINFDGVTAEKGNVYTNNRLLNNYYRAMYLRDVEYPVIENNYITSNSPYTGTSTAILFDDVVGGASIRNNHIVSADNVEFPTYGIDIDDAAGSLSNPIIISGNRVYLDDAGSSLYGIYVDDVDFIRVENNSVVIANGGTNSRAIYNLTSGVEKYFYNNILVNYSAGYTMYSSSGQITNSDYNLMYSPTGNFAYHGTAYATLADWQSATGFDANSFSMDPLFTDTVAMRHCLDVLDGAALNTGNVVADFDNDQHISPYDIGADEFTASANFDLGDDFVLCSGNDTVIAVATFDTVVWNISDTTNALTVSQPNTLNVQAINNCGTSFDTLVVQAPQSSTLASALNICAEETAVVSTGIFNASSVQWSTGVNTDSLAIDSAGTYGVQVVDSVGCATVDTIVVTQSPAVDLDDELDLCDGDVLFLNAGISGSYTWNTGSNNVAISVNAGGQYWVEVVD